MAVLELSKAAGRPVKSWSVDGDVEAGARKFIANYTELGVGRKAAESLFDGASDVDIVKVMATIEEAGTTLEEEVIEGVVDVYGVDERDTHVPQFTFEGREATKAKLVNFYPSGAVTYRGRVFNTDGSFGDFFWKFQDIVRDICSRAGISPPRFLCPDFILGTDLVWAVDMSADDAISWLLENGGMRATEKFRVDAYTVKEASGWVLYFVERGRSGNVVAVPYKPRKILRKLTKRRTDSHRWSSIQVIGAQYQVLVPDQVVITQPIQGHAWQTGFTFNEEPFETKDSAGRVLRRKYPHAIYHFLDGRVDREEWVENIYTYNSAGVLTNTRTETGEVSHDYDLQTRKMLKERTVVTATDPQTGVNGAIVRNRSEEWVYGQIATPEGTLGTIIKRHSVVEETLNEASQAQGLRPTLIERTEVIKSGVQLFKRFTRQQLDPVTGQTTSEGRTSELSAGDIQPPETLGFPGFRLELRELKSGLDTAFKKLRFPAIGEQAWLDQVLANVQNEAASWKVMGSYEIVPDLKVIEGCVLQWTGAPVRWATTRFNVLKRSAARSEDGVLRMPITVEAWI